MKEILIIVAAAVVAGVVVYAFPKSDVSYLELDKDRRRRLIRAEEDQNRDLGFI